MGKATGFMEYKRTESAAEEPLERIKHYREFHAPLNEEQRRDQAARCMDCGVPFCQNGKMLCGMISGCPLNNLIPEWNDLLYHGQKEQALKRLLMTNSFPEFTSRVCPALCEKACTCGLNDSPVTVKENERAIVEFGFENGLISPEIPLSEAESASLSSAQALPDLLLRTLSISVATALRSMSVTTDQADF